MVHEKYQTQDPRLNLKGGIPKKKGFPIQHLQWCLCGWIEFRSLKKGQDNGSPHFIRLSSLVGRVTDTAISTLQSLQIKLTHVRMGGGKKGGLARRRVPPV